MGGGRRGTETPIDSMPATPGYGTPLGRAHAFVASSDDARSPYPSSAEPTDIMECTLLALPIEILRQIIIFLVDDPVEPGRFKKRALLPLASTCHQLRAVAMEWLFWSVDLFEASFGLQHRVLKSKVALQRFHEIVDSPLSHVRTGIRRFLVRDRDETASGDLWDILRKLECLRSLHLDGPFSRAEDPFPPAPASLSDHEHPPRILSTLVNLTFRHCRYPSPLYPFFLRRGRFANLTRIEFVDHYPYPWTIDAILDRESFRRATETHVSPFARFADEEEPVFPHLNIFVLHYHYQPPQHFSHFLHFIALHKNTLERAAVLFRTDEGRASPNVYRSGAYAHATELQQRCMAAFWPVLQTLCRLKLLCLEARAVNEETIPSSLVAPSQLQGLFLRHGNRNWPLLQPRTDHPHVVTQLANRIRAPHIAYEVEYERNPLRWHRTKEPVDLATDWFRKAELSYAKSFTFVDPLGETATFVVLPGGGGDREVVKASDIQKRKIFGTTGSWSVEEDAESETPFARDRDLETETDI